MNSPIRDQKAKFIKYMPLGLRIAFVIAIAFLLKPDLISADTWLKPSGTAETNVALWLPTDAVKVEVTATADYVAEKDIAMFIRAMTPNDWEAVARIYKEGIEIYGKDAA